MLFPSTEKFGPAQGMANSNLKTGEIEVLVDEYQLLNTSKTPPFTLDDTAEVSETVRLRYRYLDLRRPSLQKNFFIRHQAIQFIRNFLDQKGFCDVETPFLTKSTPEGARDYWCPAGSRRENSTPCPNPLSFSNNS